MGRRSAVYNFPTLSRVRIVTLVQAVLYVTMLGPIYILLPALSIKFKRVLLDVDKNTAYIKAAPLVKAWRAVEKKYAGFIKPLQAYQN